MSSSSKNYSDCIEVIRNARSTAEQKKIAAASIALYMLDSQSVGGTGDITIFTNGAFGTIVSGIQNSIASF